MKPFYNLAFNELSSFLVPVLKFARFVMLFKVNAFRELS